MTFDEFVAAKDAERAERARGRVTWRKVSPMTGGGWSGIGAAGKRILARVLPMTPGTGFAFGLVVDGRWEPIGAAADVASAKAAAARALARRIEEGS